MKETVRDAEKFDLVRSFPGYNSASDKTKLDRGYLIRGSKNVRKTLRGTLASRDGLKRRGAADPTDAGTKSAFDWKTSIGRDYRLRVNNNKLQVESDFVTPGTFVWYDLVQNSDGGSPAATYTRFVFAKVWDNSILKDRIIMVRGDNKLLEWGGGATVISSGTNGNSTNTVGIQGSSLVPGVTLSTISDGAFFSFVSNGSLGTAALALIRFEQQPTDGRQFTMSIGGSVLVTFVTTLTSAGQVLIGPTLADTMNNFVGLINNPGTTNATQQAFAPASQTLVLNISAGIAGSITKTGTTSWAEDGFISYQFVDDTSAASNSNSRNQFVVNGQKYVFGDDGNSTTTLTSVYPNPASISADSIAFEVVFDTTLETATVLQPTFDMMIVSGNQAVLASYNSNVVFISADGGTPSDGGFLDFENAGDFITGDPDSITLDSHCKGIGEKDGRVLIFGGDSDLYVVTLNFPAPVAFQFDGSNSRYVFPKVEKVKLPGLNAALGHEFIGNFKNMLVWIDQTNQLRAQGTFENISDIQPALLSIAVQSELQQEDFTGGELKVIDDIIHITAPNTGRDWEYVVRESLSPTGGVTADRFWNPPQVRGISRFSIIDGVVFGHSSANPQMYQLYDTNQWYDDGPTDEPLPYAVIMRFPYSNHGLNDNGLVIFDKFMFEGYLQQGVDLRCKVYYDYQGSSGTNTLVINNPDTADEDLATFFIRPTVSLGDSSFGDEPFGDGIIEETNEQDNLPKFRKIAACRLKNCFEYSPEIYAVQEDVRFELLHFGPNIRLASQQPNFIKKNIR